MDPAPTSSDDTFTLPAPQDVSDSQQQSLTSIDAVDFIKLSWVHLLSSAPLEFSVDPSHIHYRIYQDALRYIQTQVRQTALDCDSLQALRRPLSQYDASIGTLVNLLVDKFCFNHGEMNVVPVSLHLKSTLDFVLIGVLTVVGESRNIWRDGLTNHVACHFIRRYGGPPPDPPLSQAVFLDVVSHLWLQESRWRLASRWSPMPWSQITSSTVSSVPVEEDVDSSEIPVNTVLAPLDDPTLRFQRFSFGHPFDIPWYDCPHDGYPYCSTLGKYAIIRRRNAISSLRDDAGLWLAAMTFGLLEAVTGSRIPEDLLLVPGSREGDVCLSSMHLMRFLHGWSSYLSTDPWGEDTDARIRRGQEVASLLNYALLAMDEEAGLYGLFYRAGFPTFEILRVIGTVTVALVTLCSHALSIWTDLPEMQAIGMQINAVRIERYFYLRTITWSQFRMHDAGWCPYMITENLLSGAGTIALLSNLIRLPPFIRQTEDEHLQCTWESCTFYTISDTTQYKTQHVDPSCTCDWIKPSFSHMERILSDNREDAIPVVIFDGKRLEVRTIADGPYMAVSHVWADGLGSTTEVGLPACQVKRLAALAESVVPESGAFWVDSLCVPNAPHLRKRAIRLMARTYEAAAAVLVIETSIRSLCLRSKPWTENLFRIAASAWVRRVWTLQEGILARRLYFEFADGPVDVERELDALDERAGISSEARPAVDGSTVVFYHVDMQSDGPTRSELLLPPHRESLFPLLSYLTRRKNGTLGQLTLNDVLQLVARRTTTKAEDETIAVASLLPIDIGALLSISGPDAAEKRVQEFLLQLGHLPLAFPVASGPKLGLPGFRWAPRTLAEANGISPLLAACTADGLVGEYTLALFSVPVPIPSSFSEPAVSVTVTVSHGAQSVFRLAVHLSYMARQSGSALPSFCNGVLLLDDALPQNTESKVCAGVLVGEEIPGTGEGEDEQHLLRCEYVAPSMLERTQYTLAEAEEERDLLPIYAIEDLRPVRVLLT